MVKFVTALNSLNLIIKVRIEEQANQNNGIKITDSVLSSLFMRYNGKCNIYHAPSTGLSGIQFSTLHV